MSSKVTIRQSKGVGVVGLLTLIAGVILLISGGITWWTVADKLADENITVSEDASFLAGKKVNDPFSAFAQADVINTHALEASEGKTYAELGQNDDRRETVMNASFLRASLFTSIVSFGIAALVMGLGILFIINGWALRRLAGGPPVVVETSNDSDGDRGSRNDRSDRSRAEKTKHDSGPTTETSKETSKEPGTRRSGPLASSVTTPRSSDTANLSTGATPVVADAPAPRTTAASDDTQAPTGPATGATPVAPREDPVRLSRTDRLGSSPAPAGLRPASGAPASDTTAVQPAVTTDGSSADDAVRPDGVGRPEDDARPGGWASPADRVPPPDGSRGAGS